MGHSRESGNEGSVLGQSFLKYSADKERLNSAISLRGKNFGIASVLFSVFDPSPSRTRLP